MLLSCATRARCTTCPTQIDPLTPQLRDRAKDRAGHDACSTVFPMILRAMHRFLVARSGGDAAADTCVPTHVGAPPASRGSGLRPRGLPADLVVPVRLREIDEDTIQALPRRLHVYLLLVDGARSAAEIAARTGDAPAEVVAGVLTLASENLVTL